MYKHKFEHSAQINNIIIRVVIATILVIICYRFEWHWLREITTSGFIDLSHWLGLPISRISFDTFEMSGSRYDIVLSCTMIDVYFAAIALVWDQRAPLLKNLLKLLYLFFLVMLINIARLECGFQLLFHFSVALVIAHEVVGGIAYFIVFIWIIRQGKLVKNRHSVKVPVQPDSVRYE